MSEDRNLTFRQRYGYEGLPQPMRVGELSLNFRRELWNTIRRFMENCASDNSRPSLPGRFPTQNHDPGHLFYSGAYRPLFERVIGKTCSITEEAVGQRFRNVHEAFRGFLGAEPDTTLQFIEYFINDPLAGNALPEELQKLFEEHRVAYRIDLSQKPYRIIQSTSKEESDATLRSLEKLEETGFAPALSHLQKAIEHINAGQFADSIHDSISAVESVARKLTEAKKLSEALNQLECSGPIKHKAFKEAIVKLYGYTSDEEGIRHPLINEEEANVGQPEALFFYSACAAFCGYLATVGNVR